MRAFTIIAVMFLLSVQCATHVEAAVCGFRQYDPAFYTCCNGVLNFPGRQSCCGTKAYDASFYTCCNGVVNFPGRQSCCGTKAYDASFYTCCNGQLC